MARLIDADALKKETGKWLTNPTDSRLLADVIDNAPTIDAVPVVRCKDCKNYAFADNRVPQERVWWCYYWGYEIGADDFCSMGEREDDE